jgi:Gpi18-like mannosyltransferase
MIVAVMSRLFVFAVAIASSVLFSQNSACKSIGCWTISLPFFNIFARWDSGFYADIALTGYGTTIVPRWEFFPLYPICMGILGRLIAFIFSIPLDLAVYVAGFVISNIAFFCSVYFLYRLTELILRDTRTAVQSGILLALYPAGIFLSAVYSESVFLLLVLLSLIYWYRIKRPLSGVCGFLAGLARPVGVVLAIPYFYDVFTDRSARKSALNYLSVGVVLLALICFFAYSQIMTGTPFATFAAERLYWKVTLSPAYILTLARNEIIDHPLIIPYMGMGIGGVFASIITARSKAEREIGLFSICLIAVYLLTPIISFPRYAITLVPMYWSLSKLCYWRWVRILLYAAFLVLLAVGTGQFVNWYSFY